MGIGGGGKIGTEMIVKVAKIEPKWSCVKPSL